LLYPFLCVLPAGKTGRFRKSRTALTKGVKTDRILAALFQSLVVLSGEIMPKVNVFIVDVESGAVLVRWDQVPRRRARWLSKRWKRRNVTGTAVCVS
jgi:hypothetical protein